MKGYPVDAPISEKAALLTVPQAAVILGVKPTTLRKWIHRGQLKAKRLGRIVRVSRAEVEAFVQDGKRLVKPYSELGH